MMGDFDASGDLHHKLRQGEQLLSQMMEQARRERALQAESRERLRLLELRLNVTRGYVQGLREGMGLPPPEFADD